MEEQTSFLDWEILLRPEAGEDLKPLQQVSEGDFEDGAIRSDYFVLDSDKRRYEGTALDGSIHEEVLGDEAQVGSANPRLAGLGSDSQFTDGWNLEAALPVIEFPRDDLGGIWSNASLDEERSDLASGKAEVGDAGGLENGDEIDAENEEARQGVGLERIGDIEGKDTGIEKPAVEGDSLVEVGETNNEKQSVFVRGGEKRLMVWWKLPFELLKFWAFRVKPVWSISLAAAILGTLILRKRLYMMKYNSPNIPMKIGLDEKMAPQIKTHTARLNEAFSIMRRVHIMRAAPLPTGGLTSWSMVGLP